ncbi:MAG: hypothetical protein JNM93_06670 [Bacteriovoracaceae bacterium]|nr:hypothetical protein [Bacteriovoracaceae bacterium]
MNLSKYLDFEISNSSLKLFRLSLGSIFLFYLFFLLPNWNVFFAADGILQLKTTTAFVDKINLFTIFDKVKLSIFWIWFIGVVASCLLIFNLHPRLSTILLLLVQASIIRRNPSVVNGEDLVYRMLLFYACFFPVDKKIDLLGKIAVWFSQINLLLIYVFSLPAKLLSDPAWTNGDLMYYVFINDTWSRWDLSSVLGLKPISEILTFASVGIELLVPIFIWFKRIRLFVVLISLIFHLCIGIFLQNVTFFSLAMMNGLILFLPERYAHDFLLSFRQGYYFVRTYIKKII